MLPVGASFKHEAIALCIALLVSLSALHACTLTVRTRAQRSCAPLPAKMGPRMAMIRRTRVSDDLADAR